MMRDWDQLGGKKERGVKGERLLKNRKIVTYEYFSYIPRDKENETVTDHYNSNLTWISNARFSS